MQRRSDHVTFPLLVILAALCLLGILITLLTSLTRFIMNANPEGTPRVHNELFVDRVAPFHLVNTGSMATGPTEKSPEEVYNGLCASCHRDGVDDAPIFGDHDDWQARLAERGFSGLENSALHGFNNNRMPAKGGDPRLSDNEVIGALKYMLEESGIDVASLEGVGQEEEKVAESSNEEKSVDDTEAVAVEADEEENMDNSEESDETDAEAAEEE